MPGQASTSASVALAALPSFKYGFRVCHFVFVAARVAESQARDELTAVRNELVDKTDSLGRMAEECADLQDRVRQLVCRTAHGELIYAFVAQRLPRGNALSLWPINFFNSTFIS